MHASPMTCLDEQFNICVHERNGHGDGITVGKNKIRVLAETLDGVEDVVPSATIEARRMIAKLINDL
jgi:hypothetical protein